MQEKHTLWFAVLVIVSLATYGIQSETRRSLQETNLELREAQEEIARISGESQRTIASQQERLVEQEETLEEQEQELADTKASEQLLQEAVASLQNTPSGTQVALNSLLSDFAPSVVRLVCRKDVSNKRLKQGSGMLYRGSSVSSVGPYYVQTNLHAVETDDDSSSQCVVVVYPDPTDPDFYLVYKSVGYTAYQSGVDLAFIEPGLVSTHDRAGSIDQLDQAARESSTTALCSSPGIGDHVSVLGYPGIGGDTLTVTDGIVSGFEFSDGIRYIKTSAKIDEGNSGGVAIKDSGCVLGIPTFVQSSIESLGRILDLDNLLN